MLMYFFSGFFFNLTLCMNKLRVLVLCFFYVTDNSIVSATLWCNKKDRYQELMKNFYPLPPKCKFGSVFLVFLGLDPCNYQDATPAITQISPLIEN
jgi:hypothetical protein